MGSQEVSYFLASHLFANPALRITLAECPKENLTHPDCNVGLFLAFSYTPKYNPGTGSPGHEVPE